MVEDSLLFHFIFRSTSTLSCTSTIPKVLNPLAIVHVLAEKYQRMNSRPSFVLDRAQADADAGAMGLF